jgi:sialate O-acetylesterase
MDDIKLAWKHCTPREAGNFSAVGYYFGRDLQKARGVPVGLIQSSWGGSPIESWMDPKTIASTESAPRPWHPSELFNGMIAPLIPFGIKGAAWYQGEANVGLGRALPYHLRLSDMINSWRQDWGLGNFPFLIVQIAPFKPIKEQPAESPEAELREAQSLVAKELPAVGLVVTTDVGDPATIHPTKKRPVGQRLALEARALAYGEKITFSGPLFHSMETDGSKMILSFDGTGSGLAAGGEKLAGFAVSGSNRKFVYANAQIQGDKVVVSSPAVPHPVAVRYAWADCPVANLENREGLPAVPFRTDHFAFRKDPRKP